MDTRGRSPDDNSGSICRIPEKDLKKIKVKIVNNVSNLETISRGEHSKQILDNITIVRSKSEGTKPLFERAGIVFNKDDEETNISEVNRESKSPRRLHHSRSDYFSHSSHSVERSPRRDSRSSRRESSGIHSRNTRSSRRPSRHRENSRNRDDSRNRDNSRNRDDSRDRRSRSRRSQSKNSRTRTRERRSRSRDRRTRERSHSRGRSRSWDRRIRSSKSRRRSFSPRRYEDRRGYDRREYEYRRSRERRISHSRSSRRSRSRSRSRGRYQPPLLPEPIDPNALGALPILVSPDMHFYGPDDVWYHSPLRPPVFLPRGVIPPRGFYRPPLFGPMLPRGPYLPGGPRGPFIRPTIIRPRPPRDN